MSLLSLPGEMRRGRIGSVNFFHKYGLFLGVLGAAMSVQAKDLPKAVKNDFQKTLMFLCVLRKSRILDAQRARNRF